MSVHGIADYYISEDFTKGETLGHHLGRNIFYFKWIICLGEYTIWYFSNDKCFSIAESKMFYLKQYRLSQV